MLYMAIRFYKYQGAGNDFLIADNRDGHITESDGVLTVSCEDGSKRKIVISDLCDRRYGIGADGLMLLESSDKYDFRMNYFNSDGSGGMMCGNGVRCIVAFAADMGITHFDFEAADGFHTAEVLESENGLRKVRLKMKDVSDFSHFDELADISCDSSGWFLDTGTRHFVRHVHDLETYDVVSEGRTIRYGAAEFLPTGVNVNFVEPYQGGIAVRTYEKGVEDETFACGTGIVASAIASYMNGTAPSSEDSNGRIRYLVKAKRDALEVDFMCSGCDLRSFHDIWLTGPASYVAEILLPDM